MLKIFTIFLVLSTAYCVSSLQHILQATAFDYIVDVTNMGAVGDGRTDDSQAFLRAWAAVCGAQKSEPLLLIPGGRTFLLNPVKFQGPCSSSSINIQIWGNIVAPDYAGWDLNYVQTWLVFEYVNWLKINGNGQIDGRGESWWQKGIDANNRPTALTFNQCSNLRLYGLNHINSQRNHITLTGCRNVVISHLTITAPDSSPNTDGINIGQTRHVYIQHSNIGTGDDCIAIATHSFNININHVTCGPGHGISIGSLGNNGATARVKNINVTDCIFNGTTNGARIKTWQGGSGYAMNITFERIKLYSVYNPIIIDQYYCPHEGNCQNQTSAVGISNILYHRFRGTSSSADAIILSCSQSAGCYNVQVRDVKLQNSVPGVVSKASCYNAHGHSSNTFPAVNCLQP